MTILSAIAELNGDKLQAARLLGIGKNHSVSQTENYAATPSQSDSQSSHNRFWKRHGFQKEAAEKLEIRVRYAFRHTVSAVYQSRL